MDNNEKKIPTDEQLRVVETLQKIQNRILVFSGKGGVGKSTVAVNLSYALSKRELHVGLLDVDIHGPNIAKMLGVDNMKLQPSTKGTIMPIIVSENLSLISMSFLLQDPGMPVIWRGPLKMKLIQQFLSDVMWGNLDYLIIDSPPGTGDEPLSVAQLIPATGALIVTTPQEVSLLDSRKAINFARKLDLKILGIVENMSGMLCPHCGKEIEPFKAGGGERAAAELGVPFLGRIPFDPRIVVLGDEGKPFVLHNSESKATESFGKIVDKIVQHYSQ